MFSNLLVAIDGSSTAERALEQAIDLAEALHARLTIVTVATPIPPFVMTAGVDVGALEEASREESQQRLRAAVERVPDSVSVTSVMREGSAAHQILEVLKEGHHDLLVMGSRQRGRFVSNVFGSVAADVHFGTSVPMLVIHPEPAE